MWPLTPPPLGPVLRGADGEAFWRLVWLLVLLIALIFSVRFGLAPLLQAP